MLSEESLAPRDSSPFCFCVCLVREVSRDMRCRITVRLSPHPALQEERERDFFAGRCAKSSLSVDIGRMLGVTFADLSLTYYFNLLKTASSVHRYTAAPV